MRLYWERCEEIGGSGEGGCRWGSRGCSAVKVDSVDSMH